MDLDEFKATLKHHIDDQMDGSRLFYWVIENLPDRQTILSEEFMSEYIYSKVRYLIYQTDLTYIIINDSFGKYGLLLVTDNGWIPQIEFMEPKKFYYPTRRKIFKTIGQVIGRPIKTK